MGTTFSIIAIVVLGAVYLLMRRNQGNASALPNSTRPASKPASLQYHAVSLRFNSKACDAAKNLKGKRFLSSAAPRMPLMDCDVLECQCKFVHHHDRREGDDRRNPYAGSLTSDTGKQEQEQRHSGERRADPPDEF